MGFLPTTKNKIVENMILKLQVIYLIKKEHQRQPIMKYSCGQSIPAFKLKEFTSIH